MKYKYFNKLMIAIMSLGSIFLCLYRVIALNRYKRITTDLAILIVLAIPYILSKLNIKLSEKEKSIFYGYIFVADFLGCVVNLFAKISWFDTFSHFLAGVFFFLVGLKLLKMFKQYNSKNKTADSCATHKQKTIFKMFACASDGRPPFHYNTIQTAQHITPLPAGEGLGVGLLW